MLSLRSLDSSTNSGAGFPRQSACPRCGAQPLVERLLARRGQLWAWTTQDFPPPAPPFAGAAGRDFKPFGVGYVELPDELRVEARLTEHRPDRLRIGMEMELAIVPFGTDDAGNERALLYRGRLYKRAKRTTEALRYFTAVLDINPKNAEAATEARIMRMKKK